MIGFGDRRLNKESSPRLARKLAACSTIVCVIAASVRDRAAHTNRGGHVALRLGAHRDCRNRALCKPQPLIPTFATWPRRSKAEGSKPAGEPSRASSGAIPKHSIAWRVPRRHRKLGRKRLGRRGRAGFLVRSSGAAGPCRLQSHQHRRQHDRPPHPAPRSLRLGGGAARRPREPAGLKAERGAVRSRRAPIGATALRAT